jgi:cell division protein FtsN
MLKWIPLTLAAAVVFLAACNKKEPLPKLEPMPDTAMVLPEPPELEPIEDSFPEPMAPEPEPVVAPEPPPKPVIKPNWGIVHDGPYVLQVGIFDSERQALRLGEKLKKQGFPAYIATVENPTPEMMGTYYRVRIGSFATTKSARAYGKMNLAPGGTPYWADLKARDSQPVRQVFMPKKVAPVEPAPMPVTPAPAMEAKPTPASKPAPKAPDSMMTKPAPAPEPPMPKEAAQDTKPAPELPDW